MKHLKTRALFACIAALLAAAAPAVADDDLNDAVPAESDVVPADSDIVESDANGADATPGATSTAKNFSFAARLGLLGTFGPGAELKYRFHRKFYARAVVNRFDISYEETNDGNRYKGELDLTTFGLVGDWHPTGGGFRLSGGLISNGNEVRASTQGAEFEYGPANTTYQGNADLLVDFKSMAPYLGIGYSNSKSRGFGFDFDFGVLFQGAPRLGLQGRAGDCDFRVSSSGDVTITPECDPGGVTRTLLEADLRAERRDLDDDLDKFDKFPVLVFGVSYRW